MILLKGSSTLNYPTRLILGRTGAMSKNTPYILKIYMLKNPSKTTLVSGLNIKISII